MGQSALAHVMIGLALYVSAPSPITPFDRPESPTIGSRLALPPDPRPPCSDLHTVPLLQAARISGPSHLHLTDFFAETGPCTVGTASPVAHRRSRRSTRHRRTMTSTRPTFTTPPRCLLPCEISVLTSDFSRRRPS